MHGDEFIHSPRYTTRWRQSQVEEHCPQQRVPEREDIVIVAEALSQSYSLVKKFGDGLERFASPA